MTGWKKRLSYLKLNQINQRDEFGMWKEASLLSVFLLSGCATAIEVGQLRNEVERANVVATQAHALAYQCLAKCDGVRPPRFLYR